MIEPAVIEPVFQKYGSDCAVACLSMMLGVSYPDILAATSKRAKVVHTGMSSRQIISTAKRLGMVVKYRIAPPEEDDFGMMYLTRKDDAHVALYLRNGYVIDPADGLTYTDVGAFLLAKDWTIEGFYWREA